MTLTGHRLDFDERDAATAAQSEWDSCGWPIQSTMPIAPFRTMAEIRTCGRSAGRAKGGDDMYLCWQHREAWIREAVRLIRSGSISAHDGYELTIAVLARLGSLTSDERRLASTELSELIVEYIDNLRVRVSKNDYIDPNITRALDSLIAERLHQKWGAA